MALSVMALVWLSLGRNDHHQGQRWSDGGDLEETESFSRLINHSQDRNQWQKAARSPAGKPPTPLSVQASVDTTASGEESPVLDYAFPQVSVYSFPMIRPPHAHPTLRDLGDRAQVRAIESIVAASKSHTEGSKSRIQDLKSQSQPWDDLQKALADDDEPGEKDPYLFERVLVTTVAKGTKAPPGDRLVWTRIFVKPLNFRFAAYTIAATDSETIKVTSVEATNVRKLSADIGLTIPDGPKLGLTPSNENTVKTTSDVSTQYEKLGVDITPAFLRIMRESSAGGDVIGNTKVALSLTTDPMLILTGSPNRVQLQRPDIALVVTGTHLEADAKNPSSIPSMDVRPVVPLPHCALKAKISAAYEQRHIQTGQKLYDESQQQVVFIHDVDDERTVDIMGADDVAPFVWNIQIVPPGQTPDDNWNGRKALTAKFGEHGSPRQLVFSDYGRAVELAHWVRTNNSDTDLSGYRFNRPANDGLAVMKQTNDDCTADKVVRPKQDEDAPANFRPLPVQANSLDQNRFVAPAVNPSEP